MPGIFLFSAMFGILAYFSVLTQDDLTFASFYRDTLLNGSSFPGMDPWISYAKNAFLNDNGRVADKFMPLFMLIPQWLYACLFAISAWVIFYFGIMLVKGTGRISVTFSFLVLTGLVFALPWKDFCLQRCMFVNYVFVMALCAIWLWLFVSGYRPPNRFSKVVLLLFSTITGCQHEMMTIPLVIAAIAMYLTGKREWSGKINKWLILSLILGLLIILSAPGFWIRIEEREHYPFIRSIKCAIKSGLPTIILSFCILFILSLKKYRKKIFMSLKNGYWLIIGYILMTLSSFVASYRFSVDAPRIWWLPDFISCVVFLWILKRICLRKYWINILGYVVFIFTTIYLLFSIFVQRILYIENQEIVELFQKSKGAEVFYDAEAFRLSSLSRNLLIQSSLYTSNWQQGRGLFYLDEIKFLKIIPKDLKNIDLDSLKKDGEFYISSNGHLLVSLEEQYELRFGYLFYTTPSGKLTDCQILILSIGKINGKEMGLVNPLYNFVPIQPDILHPIAIQY